MKVRFHDHVLGWFAFLLLSATWLQVAEPPRLTQVTIEGERFFSIGQADNPRARGGSRPPGNRPSSPKRESPQN